MFIDLSIAFQNIFIRHTHCDILCIYFYLLLTRLSSLKICSPSALSLDNFATLHKGCQNVQPQRAWNWNPPWQWWVALDEVVFLREPQDTPGTYPRHPQTPKWKEFVYKVLFQGYVGKFLEYCLKIGFWIGDQVMIKKLWNHNERFTWNALCWSSRTMNGQSHQLYMYFAWKMLDFQYHVWSPVQ